MLNNIIFTVKKPNSTPSSVTVLNSEYMPEYNTIVNVLDNGSIFLQTLKNSYINDVVLLKPDFIVPKLGIVCCAIILSPFNVFKQNGKWTLLGLYEDGRLRFWDLTHHKCYVISKYNEFKVPKNITLMGSLLNSKKRFVYMLSELISSSENVVALRHMDYETDRDGDRNGARDHRCSKQREQFVYYGFEPKTHDFRFFVC